MSLVLLRNLILVRVVEEPHSGLKLVYVLHLIVQDLHHLGLVVADVRRLVLYILYPLLCSVLRLRCAQCEGGEGGGGVSVRSHEFDLLLSQMCDASPFTSFILFSARSLACASHNVKSKRDSKPHVYPRRCIDSLWLTRFLGHHFGLSDYHYSWRVSCFLPCANSDVILTQVVTSQKAILKEIYSE